MHRGNVYGINITCAVPVGVCVLTFSFIMHPKRSVVTELGVC